MKKFPYKEYDDRGNLTYYESDGFWIKQNFDEKNNQIYYKSSSGNWYKKKYDDKGNQIYYESKYGKK